MSLRSFLLFFLFYAGQAQEPKVVRGMSGSTSFLRTFLKGHDPIFSLRHVTPIIPGSAIPQELEFFGYMRFPPTRPYAKEFTILKNAAGHPTGVPLAVYSVCEGEFRYKR